MEAACSACLTGSQATSTSRTVPLLSRGSFIPALPQTPHTWTALTRAQRDLRPAQRSASKTPTPVTKASHLKVLAIATSHNPPSSDHSSPRQRSSYSPSPSPSLPPHHSQTSSQVSAVNQSQMSAFDTSHLLGVPRGSTRTQEPAALPPPGRKASAGVDEVWLRIRAEAREGAESEPFLASYMYSAVLAHPSMEGALAFHLANKLSNPTLLSTQLKELFAHVLTGDVTIQEAIRADLVALEARDPACLGYAHGMLNFKGYLAIQTYRVAHKLWVQGRQALALALANRISEVFHVEIHPAARIGKGLLLDHATGVVIGETASIGDNVSILHDVTLGGTGCHGGMRHPQVEQGVLIGAGAKLLGPIRVGHGAKIGAGSVVLEDVPPNSTVVGNPGRIVQEKKGVHKVPDLAPSETMDHADFADWVI